MLIRLQKIAVSIQGIMVRLKIVTNMINRLWKINTLKVILILKLDGDINGIEEYNGSQLQAKWFCFRYVSWWTLKEERVAIQI